MNEIIKQVNLKNRLKRVAIEGIIESNKHNPFISKSQAFASWNNARKI